MTLIPSATNLVHNPRPTSATYISVTGGSVPFVTDRSYSGTGSIFATINNGATLQWQIATAGDSDITSLPSGGTYYGAFHVSGPFSGANILAWIRLTYTDATTTDGATVAVTSTSTRFERVTLPSVAATPGKTVNFIEIRVFNNSGASFSGYIGGADVRRNQAIDGFVHGSGGANYSWVGTVNNSPSLRAAFNTTPIIGSGGSIYPSIKIYVVDRQNNIIRDITSHYVDGDIGYDMDAETWKGTCRIILDDPSLITPLGVEFLRVVMRLDYPDGTSQEGSLGQFMVDLPSERWSSGRDQWTYQGKDLLAFLAQHQGAISTSGGGLTARGGMAFAAGVSYQAALDYIFFTVVGLARWQVSLPAIPQTFPSDFAWERGTSMLRIVTDILLAVGMQAPWVNPLGVITSAPAGTNPAIIAPSITLATGPNSPIRWPFQVDPDVGGIANRVQVISSIHVINHTWVPGYIVGVPDGTLPMAGSVFGTAYEESVIEAEKRKKKKHGKGRKPPPPPPGVPEESPTDSGPDIPGYWLEGDDPVFGIAVNNDPSHPISTVRLGRVIDLPDINVPQVASQAEADALANQALIKASSLPMRARVTTIPMLRGLNEVYELDMTDADGTPIDSGQGRYFCRGWTIQLGLPWDMVHTLSRVIDFASTPYF